VEEVTYILSDLTIVKLIGGLGVVISAIFIFLNNLTTEKLKSVWNRNTQKELQEIKSTLSQNNSTLTNLQMNFVHHQQNIQNKRMESIENIWVAVLKIKRGIPSPVALCLSILEDDEIKNEIIDNPNKKGESIGSMVAKLDESTDTLPIIEPAEGIDRLRPFINEELYSLFKTYLAIVGRITHKFILDYKRGKLQTWKKDDIVVQQLKSVLTEKEFKYIFEKRCSFNDMINLLEIKILDKIRETVTGAELNSDSIAQIKKLEDIWKMEKR